MQLKILFFFIFTCFSFIAQVNSSSWKLQSNDDPIVDSLMDDPKEKFIFFCPTFDTSIKDYDKAKLRLEDIINDLPKYIAAQLHFIFFKEDPFNPSKGIIIESPSSKLPYAISGLEVYYLNSDISRANRSLRLNKRDFRFVRRFSDCNYYHLDLIIKACYKSLSDHIPAYAPFIIETISPNYSDKERIQHLSDSLQLAQTKILVLENNIVSLSASMNCLEEKIDRATYLMDTIHYAEIKNIEGEYYLAPGGMYEPPVIERKIKHFPAKIAAFLSPFFAMTLILISR